MRRAFLVLAALVSALALAPAFSGVANGPDWLLTQPAAGPLARDAHAMVYDSGRGRVLLFAGANEFGFSDFSDTWEWDGTSWTERTSAASPTRRFGHAMAYDAARGRVVLFGGYGFFSGGVLADTWEWDGETWVEITAATNPPARFGEAMAYDSARQRIVMFGGNGDGVELADTWEWDGTDWIELAQAAGPPPREFGALAYDSTRGSAVLFGGYDGTTYFADTWEWDGSTWTERAPQTSPPGRTWQTLAFDTSRGRTVLFGGYDGGDTAFNDTWEWDGNGWLETTPSSNPPPRVAGAMAFDGARHQTVMFGGYDGTEPLNDVWEYDGTSWVDKTPRTTPPPRSNHAAAYDDARGKTVIFGGYAGGPFFSDTWEWDGRAWAEKTPASSPPARIFSAMAYDRARGKVVLFGGFGRTGPVADTWEWDGTSWVQRTPATSPQPRHGHKLVYDAARGRVLLFGGSNGVDWFGDTWEWDGNDWVQLTPATSPSPRYRQGMAYDAARERVVLYGGADRTFLFGDTWEWDGTSWAEKTPETRPPFFWEQGMAYDVGRQRTVMFGGSNGSEITSDTWEWDGNDWSQSGAQSRPGPRFHHTMTYDGASQRLLLFGGYNGYYLADTWTYGLLTVCGNASRVVAFAPGSGDASTSAEAALGPPDGVSVALGIGGSLDLGFNSPIQNGDGTDLIVHASLADSFRVEASDDGVTYVFVRDCLAGQCLLDLSEAGLAAASYLRFAPNLADSGAGIDAVSVIRALAPTITCPASVVVECQSAGFAVISIPPATVSDSCGGTPTVVNDHTTRGANASGTYALGTTTVTFTATDGAGSVASCSTSITVNDTTPPVVTVRANPAELWPPNHKMRPVHLTVVAVDACDPSPVVVLESVTSSERDDAGDVQAATRGTLDVDVLLRAERDGHGPGRTYRLRYVATDASGIAGAGTGSVAVPHDRGHPPPRNSRK